MKMLMQVKLPNDAFNAAVRDQTAGKMISQILEEQKPSAAYFSEFEGQRGAILIVDVNESSEIPRLAEPWFLAFNAKVEMHIAMTPQDLKKSGLDKLGKKWV
jgi:hypothetical protein